MFYLYLHVGGFADEATGRFSHHHKCTSCQSWLRLLQGSLVYSAWKLWLPRADGTVLVKWFAN